MQCVLQQLTVNHIYGILLDFFTVNNCKITAKYCKFPYTVNYCKINTEIPIMQCVLQQLTVNHIYGILLYFFTVSNCKITAKSNSAGFFCPYTQIQVLPEGGEMPIFKQFSKPGKRRTRLRVQAECMSLSGSPRLSKKCLMLPSCTHLIKWLLSTTWLTMALEKTQVQICIQEIRDCISSIVLAFGIAEDEHLIIKIILKMNDFCIKKLCSHLPLFSEMQ